MPQQPEWIPISLLSRLTGRNEGSLRRLCYSYLCRYGKARLQTSESGQEAWHIHTSAIGIEIDQPPAKAARSGRPERSDSPSRGPSNAS